MKFVDTAREYWSALAPRERTALRLAAVAIIAAALYLFLFGPGLTARANLSAALPKLHAQLEDMRQQEKEVALLRKKVSAAPRRADLKQLLQSAVARTSFVNAVERIDAPSGDKAVVIATAVVFDDWIGWVEGLQRELGIRLDACKIAALDQPGLVRIEATFVPAWSR